MIRLPKLDLERVVSFNFQQTAVLAIDDGRENIPSSRSFFERDLDDVRGKKLLHPHEANLVCYAL